MPKKKKEKEFTKISIKYKKLAQLVVQADKTDNSDPPNGRPETLSLTQMFGLGPNPICGQL